MNFSPEDDSAPSVRTSDMIPAKVLLLTWALLIAAFFCLMAPSLSIIANLVSLCFAINALGCLVNFRICWSIALLGCLFVIGVAGYVECVALMKTSPPPGGSPITPELIAIATAVVGLLPPIAILFCLALEWRRFVAIFYKTPSSANRVSNGRSAKMPSQVSPPSDNPYEPPSA